MKRLIPVAFLLLAGCATTPPPAVQITGNGFCHPSTDLPAHKSVAPVAEQDMTVDQVVEAWIAERKQHATDDRDYNSLFSECVSPSLPTAAKSPTS